MSRQAMSDKLQKLLANAGLGSRREIETWISDGRITVNGKRAKLGDRAVVADRILVDGQLQQLNAERGQTIKALLYHKPEGQICSRKDPQGRPTIFENLPAIAGGRWVSVGRLDINTSGLILLTNSGDLANKLMHPATGLEREYLVRIRGKASEQSIAALTRTGVEVDGKLARFESVRNADLAEEGTNHWYRVVIKEGRYREVRRMWDAVGHTVSRLKRIRYGTVKLTRDLKLGQHCRMAPMQLEKLVASANLADHFKGQLHSSLKPGRSEPVRKPPGRVPLNSNNRPDSGNEKRTGATDSQRPKRETGRRNTVKRVPRVKGSTRVSTRKRSGGPSAGHSARGSRNTRNEK